MEKRIKWLDFLKGITIFFVVFGHSLSSIFDSKYIAPLYFNTLISVIFTFIMPCFFAISGYLFKSVHDIKYYTLMIWKKLIGLGIPYIIFSILYVFMQIIGGSGVNNPNKFADLFHIFSIPIAYMWFLYALFLIFVIIGFLNLLKLNNYFILILCLILTYISMVFPNYLWPGLQKAFNNIIYFYIGYFINNYINKNKYIKLIHSKLIFLILTFLFLISFIFQSIYVTGTTTDVTTFSDIFTKIISIFLLFQLSINMNSNNIFRYFNRIGKYTLVIYLFHGPAISTFRLIGFKILPMNSISTILFSILLLIFVWYISILICYLSNKILIIHLIFYPYQYIKKIYNK